MTSFVGVTFHGCHFKEIPAEKVIKQILTSHLAISIKIRKLTILQSHSASLFALLGPFQTREIILESKLLTCNNGERTWMIEIYDISTHPNCKCIFICSIALRLCYAPNISVYRMSFKATTDILWTTRYFSDSIAIRKVICSPTPEGTIRIFLDFFLSLPL